MMIDQHPQLSVNGAATLRRNGRAVSLSRGERVVLAGLALDPARGVDVARLTELRWPDREPRTARQVLHNTVSSLRRKGGLPVLHEDGRYRLGTQVETDATRLRAVAEAPCPPSEEVLAALRATPRWFADLPYDGTVEVAAARLEGILDTARQRAIKTLEAADRTIDALGLATAARMADEGNEARWATEVALLVTLGRRLDAASTFRLACRTLRVDHGVGPGPRLRAVEAQLWSEGGAPATVADGPSTRLRMRVDIRRLLTGGQTVVLTGPRWIGKSHLATHVARDWPVQARVVDCGRSRRQPLAPLVDAAPGLPAELLNRVRRGPISPVDLARLVDAAVECLGDTGLVVLDDVDRLGPLSLRLLGATLRHSGARVLSTSRHAAAAVPGRDRVTVISVPPFEDREVATLAGSDLRTGRTVRPLTGGNAGLVTLLIDAARRTGLPLAAVERLSDPEHLPAPVADALHARLGPLDHAARGVVEDLALFGPRVLTTQEVGHVTGQDPALIVVRGDGTAALAHPLLRCAVLAHLPVGLRREVELVVGLDGLDGVPTAVPA